MSCGLALLGLYAIECHGATRVYVVYLSFSGQVVLVVSIIGYSVIAMSTTTTTTMGVTTTICLTMVVNATLFTGVGLAVYRYVCELSMNSIEGVGTLVRTSPA